MVKIPRAILAVIVLPLSLAGLYLYARGQWPWFAVMLTGVLYAYAIQSLPWVVRRRPLFTISLVYLVVALWLVPLGHALGFSAQPAFWLVISFLAEIGLALWIWVWLRPRFIKSDTVRLGVTGTLRRPVDIAIDDRFLHMHVLGPTGSGKTMGVLWPLVRQDIAVGHGLLVLDPKGDLHDLAVAEGKARGRRVIALRPQEEPAVGLDPFAGEPEVAAETVAYALFGAFGSQHEFYRSVGQAMLRHAALALKEAMPEPTLPDLAEFLRSEEMRREVLLEAKSAHVRRYFRDEVGGWSPRFRQDAFIGVQSALSEVLAHPWARRLFTQTPRMDFDRLLADGEMLSLALPEGEIGLGARAVGSFALLLFQSAALRRSKGPAAFIYADEFQTFAQADFGSFLAQARSHRVGAVLAHQHLGQLPEELRQAVLANARNRVLLGGLGREDLEQLRESLGRRFVTSPGGGLREAPRFDQETLRRLPRGQAVAEVAEVGRLLPPVLVRLPRP